jgi:hypothetical protein
VRRGSSCNESPPRASLLSALLAMQELEQNVINLSRRNHELKVINDTLRTLLSDRSKQQSTFRGLSATGLRWCLC